MKGILGFGRIQVRRLGLAALVVGSGFLLAPTGAVPEAAAKGGNPALRADLELGAAGSGTDAEGQMVLKQGKRRDRLKLRLRNLEPRTTYEIVDGSTDQVLRTARTNRRGRAKTSIRSAPPARHGRPRVESNLPESLEGMPIEIRRAGEEDPVLEGDVPGEAEDGTWYRVGTVSSDPEAEVQVSITMSSWNDPSLESPVDSISLSVSPGFAWIAEDGEPALGGNGVAFPDIYPLPDPSDLPRIPGPVTFWIADGEGDLHKVATVEASDFGLPMPLGMEMGALPGGILFPNRDDGTEDGNGNGGGDGDDDNDDGDNDDGDDGDYPSLSYYFWWADSSSEEGLPLGVEGVESLSGRAFEVRDGEGNVLLEGVLPELEDIDMDPIPDPLPEPLPCPDPWGGNHLPFPIDINISIDITIHIEFGSDGWSFSTGATGIR